MLVWSGGLGIALLLGGCATPLPPGAEPGPDGTMAYDVLVEASAPGARIEANGEDIGNTPVHLKIYGDPDGTFHDFGSEYYVVRALPVSTNQYAQVRVFGTGHFFGPEDRIPSRIYFDMNQPPAPASPVYVYPNYGPPVFYYDYGPPFFYYHPYYYHRYYPRYHGGLYVTPLHGGGHDEYRGGGRGRTEHGR